MSDSDFGTLARFAISLARGAGLDIPVGAARAQHRKSCAESVAFGAGVGAALHQAR